MTHKIHRIEVIPGRLFRAPKNVTMGWQEARKSLSVWFDFSDEEYWTYIVLPTGEPFSNGTLVASVICSDGFTVFHLLRQSGLVSA